MRFALLAVALAFASAAAACSSDPAKPSGDAGTDGPAACAAYAVPAGTDLTKPTVSFGTDVAPILRQSCGLSTSCHGGSRAPKMGGQQGGVDVDAKAIRTALLAASTDLPSMPFVTPSDLAKSFLMHKLDGDQCLFDKECTRGDCGESMPDDAPLLAVEQRDVVRRWIAQGAAEN